MTRIPFRIDRSALWPAWLAFAVVLLAATMAQARGAPESFADLAERALPAVVNISTSQTVRGGPEMPQFPPGSPFEEFFREFFDRQPQPEGRQRRVSSLGSGFVVDPSGYIVTNNHVIADAEEVVVRFLDETTLDAKVVGRDPKTDLALLKVETDQPLTALDFGDSDRIRVGDWIIAIGNPFGLGGSVTAGIISARQRDIRSGPYDDFLQTDASINKGNSGGPMLDMDGRVIGISTAIYSPSGGSVGIGFAVPSALAGPVIDQLLRFGETRRGWLGVRIQSVTDAIAESLGLGEVRGALVASVTADGPAEKGGIEVGDVILSFDGKPVDRMRRLPRIVAETAVDREVDVEVWRKGQKAMVKVVVGRLDETEVAALTPAETDSAEPSEVAPLGLALAPLTEALRSRYEVRGSVKGVVVAGVTPGGPSEDKGIREGDVLIEVNQDPVETPADVEARVTAAIEAGRRSVLMLLDRQGDLRFVAVTIGNSR